MKKTLLGALLLLSINTALFSQTIIDVKKDVTNYCKKNYDLFKPVEWSNYELEYKKLGISNDEIDTSLYKNIDKFFKGDTTKPVFNSINNFQYSFYYSYVINNKDTVFNKASNTLGRTSLNKRRYNFITDNWSDTLYFNYKNNKIITNNNDTLKILDRYILDEDLPKKIAFYVNCYKIRLVYNALSNGGDVRIYSTTFSVNYYLNGKLLSVYKQ